MSRLSRRMKRDAARRGRDKARAEFREKQHKAAQDAAAPPDTIEHALGATTQAHDPEWLRAYGSPERASWIQSLPCVGCNLVGYSQNAHTKTGGMGRKADAKWIVPLCGPHFDGARRVVVVGCHQHLHNVGAKTFAKEKALGIPLTELAEGIEVNWQARLIRLANEARANQPDIPAVISEPSKIVIVSR